jgi:hypothetical protein
LRFSEKKPFDKGILSQKVLCVKMFFIDIFLSGFLRLAPRITYPYEVEKIKGVNANGKCQTRKTGQHRENELWQD